MIENKEPLSMTESLKYIGDEKEGDVEVKKFMKKFVKLEPEDAVKLKEKLHGLNLLKLKQEYAVKIIDLMPENQENLNKIFTDVNLDADESKKILDVIEEFR